MGGNTLKSDDSFKVHSKQTHGEKCKCKKCDLGRNTSISKDNYKVHGKYIHDPKCNCTKCDLGDKSDKLSNGSNVHMDLSHDTNDNSCDKSGKLSKSLGVQIEHTHNHNCSCYKCQRSFSNVKHTEKHETTSHELTEKDVWNQYDSEFSDTVSHLREKISNGNIEPAEAATQFSNLLTVFLSTKPNLVREVKTLYKHKPTALNNLKDARALKNELEKKARQKAATAEDRSLATQALRHYDFLLKESNRDDEANEIKEQERKYKRNFHKFAKDVVNGSYGKERLQPTYSESTASAYYKDKYSKEVHIDLGKLDWFPEVQPPTVPYNLTPYTEEDVREALKGKNKSSSPGEDQI